jgi:hypothetical protein
MEKTLTEEAEKKIKAEAEELYPTKKGFFEQNVQSQNNGFRQEGYIAAASKYLPQGEGWISVEDRLPEKLGFYIVARRYGQVHNGYFDENGWRLFTDSGMPAYSDVTHWQPLPAPPIDQQKKEEV